MYTYVLVFIINYITYNHVATGYNIDTTFPIIFENPENDNGGRSSYFGFSSALAHNKGESTSVYIGAPRANYTGTSIDEPGALYHCSTTKACEKYMLTKKDNDLKERAWIGVAMDIKYPAKSIFESLMVCGHRWGNENKNHLMDGVCYAVYPENKTVYEVSPLFQKANEDERYRMGQAGISVHIPIFSGPYLGTPGVNNWKGYYVSYNSLVQSKEAEINKNTIGFGQPHGYLGYQITSGAFFSEPCDVIVASSPREDFTGKVYITPFHYECRDTSNKETVDVSGTMAGEYFGASLAVAKLNNDIYDDLIVGAPMYGKDEGRIYVFYGSPKGNFTGDSVDKYIRKGIEGARFGTAIISLGKLDDDDYDDIAVGAPYENNRGAIYIYNGGRDILSKEPSQRIQAEEIYQGLSGFGISFSQYDKNKENNAVGIGSYLSGHTVLLRVCSVVHLNVTVTLEHDFKKIEQNTAKFTVTVSTQFNSRNVDTLTILQKIEVDRGYKRGHIDKADEEKNITLEKNVEYNQNIDVYINNVRNENETDPFIFNVTNRLIHNNKPEAVFIGKVINGTDGFNKNFPVLSKESKMYNILNISVAKGCVDDNNCTADLYLDYKIKDISENDIYVIDSSQKMQLDITVTNKGVDPAYGVKLYISFMAPLPVTSLKPNYCDKDSHGTKLNCSISTKLRKEETGHQSLEFSLEDIKDTKFLWIMIRAESKTNERNSEDNSRNISIKFEKRADVSITGKSKDEKYTIGKSSSDRSIYNFKHIYEVQKFERSPINEAEVNITVPRYFHEKGGNKKKILNISKLTAEQCLKDDCTNITCTGIEFDEGKFYNGMENMAKDMEDVNYDALKSSNIINNVTCTKGYPFSCTTFTCKTKPFNTSQTTAKFTLEFQTNISEIQHFLGVKDVVVFTRGNVRITQPQDFGNLSDTRPDFATVYTTFTSTVQTSFPYYYIIIAIIVGLLLFILLVYILIRAGFFRREKKEQLLKEKNENGIETAAEFHYSVMPEENDIVVLRTSNRTVSENFEGNDTLDLRPRNSIVNENTEVNNTTVEVHPRNSIVNENFEINNTV